MVQWWATAASKWWEGSERKKVFSCAVWIQVQSHMCVGGMVNDAEWVSIISRRDRYDGDDDWEMSFINVWTNYCLNASFVAMGGLS